MSAIGTSDQVPAPKVKRMTLEEMSDFLMDLRGEDTVIAEGRKMYVTTIFRGIDAEGRAKLWQIIEALNYFDILQKNQRAKTRK